MDSGLDAAFYAKISNRQDNHISSHKSFQASSSSGLSHSLDNMDSLSNAVSIFESISFVFISMILSVEEG